MRGTFGLETENDDDGFDEDDDEDYGEDEEDEEDEEPEEGTWQVSDRDRSLDFSPGNSL